MRKLKVLVIEDDPLARELVKGELSEHDVEFASDLAAGRKKIGARRNDICFIDLKLSGKSDDKSGLELVPMAAKAGGLLRGHVRP